MENFKRCYLILKVGSLFSGIGGIELGFERTGSFKTAWFIENNLYCQAVLKKHWPTIPIYNDITKIDWNTMPPIDILTVGFPCQDISQAGKGKGITKGQRSSLWKHYAEAIRILRPKIALVENVPMLTHRGLNIVLANLAENGYDAEWFCLQAGQFARYANGPLHKRERIFIITYPNRIRRGRRAVQTSSLPKDDAKVQRRSSSSLASHTGEFGRLDIELEEQSGQGRFEAQCEHRAKFITHDWSQRVQRFRERSLQGQRGFSWCKDVRRVEDFKGRPDIPEPLFRGSRDGVPCWVDRIRGCGNAVVPQIAEFIAQRVKEVIEEES